MNWHISHPIQSSDSSVSSKYSSPHLPQNVCGRLDVSRGCVLADEDTVFARRVDAALAAPRFLLAVTSSTGRRDFFAAFCIVSSDIDGLNKFFKITDGGCAIF